MRLLSFREFRPVLDIAWSVLKSLNSFLNDSMSFLAFAIIPDTMLNLLFKFNF